MKTLNKSFANLFYLIIALVLLGPRVPLFTLNSEKIVDIRIEDIAIFFMMIIFFIKVLYRGVKAVIFFPHEKFLLLYTCVVIITWILNLNLNLNLNQLLYFAKDLEFIVFFLMSITFYKSINISKAWQAVNFSLFVTVLFYFYQIISGNLYGQQNGYYGVGSVLEYSTLSSATIFSFLSIYAFFKNKKILSIILLSAVFMTFSRAVVFGLILSSFFYISMRFNRKTLFILMAVILLVFLLFIQFENRVFNFGYILSSLTHRYEQDYLPIFNYFQNSPQSLLIGAGKGLLGLNGIPIEVHNYYLRVLFESGIMALVFFLLFFYFLIRRVRIDSNTTATMLFIFVISLMISMIVQDTFANQKVLGVFYFLLSIYGIERRKSLFKKRFS
jgi:hypothetical protein